MTVVFVVGGWIALNIALVVALLLRRDRPEAREKLVAWVLKGRRQLPRGARSRPEHQVR